jgi:exopolysaccharide biosynthesis WecB/TagA/CpsF family protein
MSFKIQNPIQTQLLRVFLSKITPTTMELLKKINNLAPKSKTSLYLLYSEFFLRSKHNLDYTHVLLEADLMAVDGKGVLWGLDRVQKKDKKSILQKVYALGYLLNFINAINSLIFKAKFGHGIENILGRDLVYDLLDIASNKNWKVTIIGANLQQILNNLRTKYSIEINGFDLDSTSLTMKDGLDFEDLSRHNLLQKMPDLQLAKDFIKTEKPDLVLVCLGEFLIDNLVHDQKVEFGLAVGLGAALDHLGGGKKQKPVPKFMEKMGLEALWRIFVSPYRTKRVLDSVFGFVEYVTREILQR